MPIIDYVSQGAEKVVGDIKKQIDSLDKLQKEINECNGDTTKMTEVVKAFVLEQGKAATSTKKLTAAEKEQAKEAANIERILGKQLTRAQRLGQEYRTLSNHLKQLKLNPDVNADQIRRTEAALKRIREELRQNTAEFKRNADAASAGANIARQAIERTITPLERYRRGVMQVNEALRQNKITSTEARTAQQSLWRDYQAGIAGGNKQLGFMGGTLLPGIKGQVVSIAAAFGLGGGVAGMIFKAREELQKLNEVRKQMQTENVSVAAAEVALGEVIGHKDPKYLSLQKSRVRALADKMQLPYTTVFPLVHDAISASMEPTMDAKIDDALEVSEAAAMLFPHDPQKARETALGAQNIRKWDPSIKNAKEAVGRVQILGLAGQVADMKKVAENAPRAIGAVAPFGDSPAFGAALWGEGTHLMTDPNGAMEVGFVARMEKFLFDFSQARDKKTGKLLNPDMVGMKTGEERLRYIQKISLERPEAFQGEMIEYLKGLSPEKTSAILEDAVGMTEEQLKLPEEFIKGMKGKGLAIQWGPMVMMLTNKQYIKRLQDRIDEMNKMWGDAEGFFNADVLSRQESYKPLIADMKIKWLKEKSASEYSDAGVFNEIREMLVNELTQRTGTPSITREIAKWKDLQGGIQDWSDLFDEVGKLMTSTAGNPNISHLHRIQSIKNFESGMESLWMFMPEEERSDVKNTLLEYKKRAHARFLDDTLLHHGDLGDKYISRIGSIGRSDFLHEYTLSGGDLDALAEKVSKKAKQFEDVAAKQPGVMRSKGLIEDRLSRAVALRQIEKRIREFQNNQNIVKNVPIEQKQVPRQLADLPGPFGGLPQADDIPIEQKQVPPPKPNIEPPSHEPPPQQTGRLRLSPEYERERQEILRRREEGQKLNDTLTKLAAAVETFAAVVPIIRDIERDRVEIARQNSFGHPWLSERPEADIRHV